MSRFDNAKEYDYQEAVKLAGRVIAVRGLPFTVMMTATNGEVQVWDPQEKRLLIFDSRAHFENWVYGTPVPSGAYSGVGLRVVASVHRPFNPLFMVADVATQPEQIVERRKTMQYIIKYRGVLTEMYVTGFSEPMVVDGSDNLERSVKASNRIADAKVFSESEVAEALELTRRCHPSAEKVEV